MRKSSIVGAIVRHGFIAGLTLGIVGCAVGDEGEPHLGSSDEEKRSTDSREIVGGTNTTIETHPWQISLQTTSGSHYCGGSVISSTWILTAAHCVSGSAPSSMRVRAGITKRSEGSTSGQVRNVSQVIVYPGYADASQGKDAALLKLSSPLDLSGAKVKAIPIMSAAFASAGATAPGVISTVTGWGTLSAGSPSLPDTLQAVDVPIVSNQAAQDAYTNETITADQLAAGIFGTGGKDSCQGDSGGPLTVNTSAGRALAGIVSWGYGCGDPQYPGMYGRVSAFETWILSNTDATPIGGGGDPDPNDPPDPEPNDPTPVEVTLLSQTSLSASQGNFRHWAINVPVGSTKLVVNLSGGTGDADLYVKRGSQSTTSSYDCRPYLNGNQETCTFNNPVAGTWYVSIRAYTSYSGVSVTAKATTGGTAPSDPVTLLERTNLSGSRLSWVTFSVPVTAGKARLSVTTSGGTGDADLYVRYGSAPTTSTYDCRPYTSGNSETCTFANPAGGTWHIAIRGYSAYSGVTLKAVLE
jgi:hypothetical protein